MKRVLRGVPSPPMRRMGPLADRGDAAAWNSTVSTARMDMATPETGGVLGDNAKASSGSTPEVSFPKILHWQKLEAHLRYLRPSSTSAKLSSSESSPLPTTSCSNP